MEVAPWITPPEACLSPLVFVPSDDAEVLCFDLFTGHLVSRFRGMERHAIGRVTCITGRYGHQVFAVELGLR